MVKCEVCDKNLKDEFALKAHYRLSTDPEHQAYYMQQQQFQQFQQQEQEPVNNKEHLINALRTDVKPIPTGELRAVLQNFVHKYKDDTEMGIILKKALEDDRLYEEDYKKTLAENEDIRRWNANFAKENEDLHTKVDTLTQENKDLKKEGTKKEGMTEGFEKGMQQGEVNSFFICSSCNYGFSITTGQKFIVSVLPPEGSYHRKFLDFLGHIGIICPECAQRRGTTLFLSSALASMGSYYTSLIAQMGSYYTSLLAQQNAVIAEKQSELSFIDFMIDND